MADDGHAFGHVLDMRTISLVGPAFSTIVWNEAVRWLNVDALVITPPISGHREDDDLRSPFILELVQGHSPSWTLALRSGRVLVYIPASSER